MAQSFHKKVAESLPEQLEENLQPVVEIIASLTEKIKGYDQRIEALVTERAIRRQASGELLRLSVVINIGLRPFLLL